MSVPPSPFDAEKYTRELQKNWSSAAPHYDKLSSRYFADVARLFVDFTGLRPGWKVLDVACGSGLAALEAARLAGPAGRVLGVDLAGGMLDLARGKAAERGFSNCEFREMGAEKLDLPDEAFDAVICHLGLMLFARPEHALSEMRRVAKPGAVVACLVQGRQERMVFTGLINGLLFKQAPELRITGAPSIFRFGPPGSLELAFDEAGLAELHTARLRGLFPFDSPRAYWETMTEGSGRLRSMIDSLPPGARSAFEAAVLSAAETYRKGARLEIPYEFVMAKGLK